jgi:cGMP-dependent protein kinase
MAPEVILGKGYDHAIDYWALGICLYQFLYGFLPFGDRTTTPYLIYEEIKKKEIKFPQTLQDNEAKKLIKQLLNRTPEVRLGGSFKSLKSHPWFRSVNWVSY